MLGEKNPTLDKFRAALADNGAEFPVSNVLFLNHFLHPSSTKKVEFVWCETFVFKLKGSYSHVLLVATVAMPYNFFIHL